jgi:hypothetical protein
MRGLILLSVDAAAAEHVPTGATDQPNDQSKGAETQCRANVSVSKPRSLDCIGHNNRHDNRREAAADPVQNISQSREHHRTYASF